MQTVLSWYMYQYSFFFYLLSQDKMLWHWQSFWLLTAAFFEQYVWRHLWMLLEMTENAHGIPQTGPPSRGGPSSTLHQPLLYDVIPDWGIPLTFPFISNTISNSLDLRSLSNTSKHNQQREQTSDLLILSPTPYLLDHILPSKQI